MHPDPPDYQPPLTWWSHLWRFVVVLLIGAVAWVGYAEKEWDISPALVGIDLGLGIMSLVLMQFRRRWPFTIALLTALPLALSATAAGPSCLTTVSLATRRNWVQIIPVGLIGLAGGMTFATVVPVNNEPLWLTFTTNVVFTVALVAIGMYIGSRRELLWTLRDRAIRAEDEQGLRVAQARTNERARIAREMHDVLAHRISLVTMHAGALSYRTDLSRDEVAKSADIIQSNSHEALTELRNVLGVLRGEDVEASRNRPQPTFHDVDALIEQAQDSGMNIEFVNELDTLPALTDAAGRTVYRIVQEGLTNARKHAPDAKVSITIHPYDAGIAISVTNPLRVGRNGEAPDSGLGLVGLAERADLSGGELHHQINGRGEFELNAWLPCPP